MHCDREGTDIIQELADRVRLQLYTGKGIPRMDQQEVVTDDNDEIVVLPLRAIGLSEDNVTNLTYLDHWGRYQHEKIKNQYTSGKLLTLAKSILLCRLLQIFNHIPPLHYF